MRLPVLLLLPAIVLAACDKRNEPPPAETAGTSRPATHGSAKPAPPSGPSEIAWDAPPGWMSAAPGPMRKATYVIKHVEGDSEDAELSVSQAGGTVAANVARWAQQLGRSPGDVKRSERKVQGLAVTVVEIHGDYTGMRIPGAPPPATRSGYALLGAIIETSPPTFFKLVGPEKSVMATRGDFDKLVDGVRPK